MLWDFPYLEQCLFSFSIGITFLCKADEGFTSGHRDGHRQTAMAKGRQELQQPVQTEDVYKSLGSSNPLLGLTICQ